MNLLFYSPAKDGVGKQLQAVIESIESPTLEGMEIHRTIGSLSRRLCQATYNVAVTVILAATKEDLADALSIKELIWDIRIILILPDREEDTIAKGHTLRPRFLTYADGNFVDVAAVLHKMLANNEAGL
ncbi:MAG: hypothetical protein HWN68_11505 [Desulfobacterales bacterium]|nr:hypothetical protein [Desulfobacterales bacterium]